MKAAEEYYMDDLRDDIRKEFEGDEDFFYYYTWLVCGDDDDDSDDVIIMIAIMLGLDLEKYRRD